MPSIVPQDRLARRIFLILLGILTVILLAAPSKGAWWGRHDGIEGSGHAASRSFEVKDFDSIRIEGVAEVEIVWGEDCAVSVQTDDNLLDLARVEVRGKTLHLDQEDHDGEIDTEIGWRYTVTLPRLHEVRIDGVGEVRVREMDQDEFRLRIDGVGNVEMDGKVERLDCQVQGVGEADLRDLVAQEVRVRVSGVGEVLCHAKEDLDAEVSGMGKVRYYGDPKRVRDSVDGFGRIAAR